MRKSYFIIGTVALGVGILLGAVGYALATAQSSPGTAAGTINTTNPLPVDNRDQLEGEGDDLFSSPEEEVFDSAELDLSELETETQRPRSTLKANEEQIPEALEQEILASYKLNVAKLFEAWQSPDMITFRTQLKEAYTGELFEKHARRAEPYIVQGVGLKVWDIFFEDVKVDTATDSTATLTASYTYTVQDYDIGNDMTMGQSAQHQVNVRVNMVKIDSRWLITGETKL